MFSRIKKTSARLDETDGHTIKIKEVEGEIYSFYVLCGYMLGAILFVKFKQQLQMVKKMNDVITLVELSLRDATYFLAYYLLLLIFFCAQFMILGSVISPLDYPEIKHRFIFYLIQNFRNSLGDF